VIGKIHRFFRFLNTHNQNLIFVVEVTILKHKMIDVNEYVSGNKQPSKKL